jgi:hypothetical protein
MADERAREELSEQAAALARRLVAERFPEGGDGPRSLAEMEEALAEVKRELGEQLQRLWIEQQEGEAENRTDCATCAAATAGTARFCGNRERLLVTRHGELRFWRRYYHCARCRTGFAPLDQRLGLDGHATTAQVRAWLADLGSDGAFATAARRLETFTAVRVSESTAARVTVEVGRRLREEELREAEQILAGEAVPRRTPWQPQRLYVSLDGTMTPLRDPWKRDGSRGRLHCRYGECKTAVCYETRPNRQGTPVVARRQYTATLEPVETFEKLVAGLAYHCGSDRAPELVVLADGLGYNWRIAEEYFPEALQILDFYHALDHLHRLARLCWEGSPPSAGEDTPLTAAAWVALQKEALLRDGVAEVETAIAALSASTAEARECREETQGYFARNAERMRYRTFLEAGYQIGSGVMEAGCKTVAHQRLDQSGMHWRSETADAVVALRANQLSHQPRPLRPYCADWS